MPDSSANNNVVTTSLTQGNGATIWASPAEQAKHECIVLASQYTTTLIDSIGALTEDDHQWSKELTLVSNLLLSVIDEYSVDENRVYGTGQWDTQLMYVMKDDNLWIVVCEGDTKAYPGMNEATTNWEALGIPVATSEMWDSTYTPEEFDPLVADMQSQGRKINYTVFECGNHMYTWTVAYNIEWVRDWLFTQVK